MTTVLRTGLGYDTSPHVGLLYGNGGYRMVTIENKGQTQFSVTAG